jgi:hypothetical protein
MHKQWYYLINPFEVATRGSYYMTKLISEQHLAALESQQSDPYFANMASVYTPIHDNFANAYNDYRAQRDLQQGQTLNLNQLYEQLSGEKIESWDIAIQMVYRRRSPDYMGLLPHFRKPFQRGNQMQRITHLNALNLGLTGIAALSAVKTDVDNFCNLINSADDSQKSSLRQTSRLSGIVETAKHSVCTAMYINLGALIQKYGSTPENIAPFFDLQHIRNFQQVDFTGHLKPSKLHHVCKRTFAPDDIITVTNNSDTPLQLYLSSSKNMIVNSPCVTIAANTTTDIEAKSLGDNSRNHLIIYNPDSTITAEWEIVLK